MDSVFGGIQKQFEDQFLITRMSTEHPNLGIPTDMQLVGDIKHSLIECLDIELPLPDRGFADHVYKMSVEFKSSNLRLASDPDLVGPDPASSRYRWFQTYQSLSNIISCIGRLRFFRDWRKQ